MVKVEHFDSIVAAVIKQESSGRADAVSNKGAQGLMQLMPDTAKDCLEELGLDVSAYDPFDPQQNERLGRHYLTKLIKMFGDVRMGLAAYNAGPGRVSRLAQKYGDDYKNIEPILPTETQKYVAAIAERLAQQGIFV